MIGTLGVFEHPFFCKIEKKEGGTLRTHLKKFRKKDSQSRKNCPKNFWSWAGLEPVLLLGRPQKSSKKLEAEEATLV